MADTGGCSNRRVSRHGGSRPSGPAPRHRDRTIPIVVVASGPILVTMMPLRSRHPAFARLGPWTLLSALLTLVACTVDNAVDEADTGTTGQGDAVAAEGTEAPGPMFISLEPWGEVDFERGQFPSRDACLALVRSLPTYSFYTTSERCESIIDPVYCTVWRDGDDDRDSIGCHKGPGGCEIELRRHDLGVEAGTRTVSARCEAYALDDAWEQYLAATQTTLRPPQ